MDVQREIVSLAYAESAPGETTPLALSNEGDVYLLDDIVRRAKVRGVGVGVESPDADGRGAATLLAASGATVLASDAAGGLHVGRWDALAPRATPAEGSTLMGMGGVGDGTFVLVTQSDGAPEALPDFDFSTPETAAASRRACSRASLAAARTGQVWHLHDGRFGPVEAPNLVHARGIAVGSFSRVAVAGVSGLLAEGSIEGVARIPSLRSELTFLSALHHEVTILAASDAAFRRWDRATLTTISPPLSRFLARAGSAPLAILHAGTKALAVDQRQGMFLLDGTAWTRIDVPVVLTAKQFDPRSSLEAD